METGAQQFISSLIGSPTFIFDQGNLEKISAELVALNLQPTAQGYKIAYLSLLERPDKGGLRTKELVAPKAEPIPVAKAEPVKKPFEGTAADRLYNAGGGATSRLIGARATGDEKEVERQNIKKNMQDAVQAVNKATLVKAQRKEIDDIAIYTNGKFNHAQTGRAKEALRKKYGL
jgi:hypothetical protein